MTTNKKQAKNLATLFSYNLVAKELNLDNIYYAIEDNFLATESKKTGDKISEILLNKLSQKDISKIYRLLIDIQQLNHKTNNK